MPNTSVYRGFRWTKGDADNFALALVVDSVNMALHMAEAGDVDTDWNVTAAVHPTLYIHSATNPATEYLSVLVDATNAIIRAVGNEIRLQPVGVVNIGPTTAGTAAAPGLIMDADVDTGWYRSAADFFNISTGGTQRMNLSVSGMKLGNSSANHATTVGTNSLSIYLGTAPVGTLASGGSMYVATATNVELNYIDSGGNAQQLSTT